MTNVQYAAQPILKSRFVWFEDANNVDLQVGSILCLDLSAPETPAGTDWPEKQLGIQCVRPATANLSFVAGIVKKFHKYRTTQGNEPNRSHFVEIWTPQYGDIVPILCNANLTAGATLVKAANASFVGVNSATLISAAATPADIAVALKAMTAGASPALIPCRWLH